MKQRKRISGGGVKRSQSLVGDVSLPESRQPAWQLAAIQLTGVVSLPVIASSFLLIQGHSTTSAIVNLLLGNVILLLVRFGIVLLSHGKRQNTIEIARTYLGFLGGYLIALALLLSGISDFFSETTLATSALTVLAPLREGSTDINLFTQYATIFGVISTALCMEGMKSLKWLSIVTLPILLVAFGVIAYCSPEPKSAVNPAISLSGSALSLMLAANLGVTADMPTFFRHSRSRRSSLHAVWMIQAVSLAVGIGSLFIGRGFLPIPSTSSSDAISADLPLRIALIVFVLSSIITANVANVYSASVAWELIAPKALTGRKEYLLLGFLLSLIFILFSGAFSLEVFAEVTDYALMNLGIALILGWLVVKLFRMKEPSSLDKGCYLVAWVLATMVALLQAMHISFTNWSAFIYGLIIIPGVALATRVLLGASIFIIKRSRKSGGVGEDE